MALSIRSITIYSYQDDLNWLKGPISQDMTNGLIISRERAEQNGLEVGSKVVGINDPYTDDPEVDMEIVGIFEVVADKNDEATMYDASTCGIFLTMPFVAKLRWRQCV